MDFDNKCYYKVPNARLQYLYLLFDEDNFVHRDDSNYVFTTEGHILTLDREHLRPLPMSRRKMRPVDNHQCPVYKPFIGVYDNSSKETGLVRGIRSRSDYDYARKLVGVHASSVEIDAWSANGWCEKPMVENFVSLWLELVDIVADENCSHTTLSFPLTGEMYRRT